MRRLLALTLLAFPACHHATTVHDQDAAACSVVQAPRSAALPHVVASASAAQSTATAVAQLLAAHSPAVAAAKHDYAFDTLICSNVFADVNGEAAGYTCSMSVRIDGAPAVDIDAASPSSEAQALYSALATAGAGPCLDEAHADYVSLLNVALGVATPGLEFDDGSIYRKPYETNVVIEGAEAQAIVAALAASGTTDCNPAQTLFLVCNDASGSPECGGQKNALTAVQGSELVYACRPTTDAQPVTIDDASSLAIWKAMSAGASSASYQPLHGTVAEAKVLNATSLGWDGTRLSLFLTMDTASAPPAP